MNSSGDSASASGADVFTSGELLDDGSLLELVRLFPGTGEVGLMRAEKHGNVQIASQLEIGGKLFRPVALPAGVRSAINLPTAPRSYASTRDLFEHVVRFLRRYTGLTSEDSRLAAYFVFATWFADFLPRLFGLLVSCAFPAEVVSLLRSLRLLCRNSMLLGDLNVRSFCSLPLRLMPTVIMDQTRVSPRLMGVLHLANVNDLYLDHAGQLISPGGFHVLFPGQGDIDPALALGMLQVALAPRQCGAQVLDARGVSEAQCEIQPELLAYRLRNFPTVAASKFDFPEFVTPFREIATSFATVIVDDEVLQAQIASLLRPQADEARAQQIATPEFAITTVVLAYLHARETYALPVYKLCEAVNAALASYGEFWQYSPSQIGYRLIGLGLFTVRTSGGKVLRLNRETSRKVHDLARRLGVSLPVGGFPGCPECGEPYEGMGLLQGVQGV